MSKIIKDESYKEGLNDLAEFINSKRWTPAEQRLILRDFVDIISIASAVEIIKSIPKKDEDKNE